MARNGGVLSPPLYCQILLPPTGELSLQSRADFLRLPFPFLSSALTCTPCDRPPSAISRGKVRPLLDSALASPSSVPRLSPVPHPPGARRSDSLTRSPATPSITDPARSARRGEGQVPCPGRVRAEPRERRDRGATAAAQELQSRSASLGRCRGAPARSLSSGSAPSVAPRGRARRPRPGLGRGGSPEPGAPMRRLAAAARQL